MQPIKNNIVAAPEYASVAMRCLPETSKRSIWRYSRRLRPSDPAQGWKLHVSATVLSAARILDSVAPYLIGLDVLFKAPRSLEELNRINRGLEYGFSQVGKFITVYPGTPTEAVAIARELHLITRGEQGPAVPFDQPYRSRSCIFYRYGAFRNMQLVRKDGRRVPAISNLRGRLVPDGRSAGIPAWVANPFGSRLTAIQSSNSRLRTTYLAYQALSQRGKGGVYKALDLSVLPARLCVLKEGRRNGETDLDRRDGHWRVRNERRVLRSLLGAGVTVPRIYESFRVEGNYYLACEFIEGESLQTLWGRYRSRWTTQRILRYGIQLADLIRRIHAAGWIWRDCKPMNLILGKDGNLRPLDFEGACPISRPDPSPWGTVGYMPPTPSKTTFQGATAADDLFALGATMHQLLSGRRPDARLAHSPALRTARCVPVRAREVLEALLSVDPDRRPDARTVCQLFEQVLPEAG